ncbi:MAG TPA: hypothetical protein VF402_01430 [Asticcacaulis sp.]
MAFVGFGGAEAFVCFVAKKSCGHRPYGHFTHILIIVVVKRPYGHFTTGGMDDMMDGT